MIDQRRLVLDFGLVSGGQRRKQIVRYRLSPSPLGNPSVAPAVLRPRNSIEEFLEIGTLIPDVERRHCRILAEMLAVGTNRRSNGVSPIPGFMPAERPATSILTVNRLTSHSQGSGSVSSKSLMSKTRLRSGVANAPKFIMWQSPHAWTRSPVRGVSAKSNAITAAAPRRKANGDCCIRP